MTTETSKLSDEELRIKVAELCGTLACPGCGWKEVECWSHNHKAPNYPADLNAMAEAEKMLTDEQCWIYDKRLQIAMMGGSERSGWLWQAKARQRAEAFVVALGA